MDQCGSTRLERAKQNFFKVYQLSTLKKEILHFRNVLKIIQVLGLLGHLSTYITVLTLNAYQTVSLTVTLLTYVMRILILRWASHLDAFSGYPLHT